MRGVLHYQVFATAGKDLALAGLELPLVLSLEGGVVLTFEMPTGALRYVEPVVLRAAMPVDPSLIEFVEVPWVRTGPEPDSPPSRFATTPEALVIDERAALALSSISFILGVGVSAHRILGHDILLAEGPEDEYRLESHESQPLWTAEISSTDGRTFYGAPITQALIDGLMLRPGVVTFADALNALAPAARYRDLWRTLELAFGQRDRELVQVLSVYPPVVEMGFTHSEIKGFHVLRGRASHGQSRKGLREVVGVEREVLRLVGRLQSLVERVVLTKKNWGTADLDVDELLALEKYMLPEGEGTFHLNEPGWAQDDSRLVKLAEHYGDLTLLMPSLPRQEQQRWGYRYGTLRPDQLEFRPAAAALVALPFDIAYKRSERRLRGDVAGAIA